MIWAAATAMAPGVGLTDVRDQFVDDVHGFLWNGVNDVPFSDRFFVRTNESDSAVEGAWDTYRARPVVGGEFALLALAGHDLFG